MRMILGEKPGETYPVKTVFLKYGNVRRKVEYYAKWFNELNVQEQNGWLGHWIRERIRKYDEALNDKVELN